MPNHTAHTYVDRLCTGTTYWKVHKFIDWPAKYLKRDHRRYFHDLNSVLMCAQSYYPGDQNAYYSGWLHILTDYKCSDDRVFIRWLEGNGKIDVAYRRHMRRGNRARDGKYYYPLSKLDIENRDFILFNIMPYQARVFPNSNF
jgi:hypothetical protein